MPKEKTTKEKLLEEFNEFTKTLEADFITEGYSAYGDLEDFISQTIDRVREETIRAVEERLPKAQKINKKDWLGLNYTLGDVKYREHQYRLLVLDILNKLKK